MRLWYEKSYHTFEWEANKFSVFVRPSIYDIIIHKLFIRNSF